MNSLTMYIKLGLFFKINQKSKIVVVSEESVSMKKFSPPEMKEVSFPTPYTPHPTPSFKTGNLQERISLEKNS